MSMFDDWFEWAPTISDAVTVQHYTPAPSEVLTIGRARIENGWCQGKMKTLSGEVCTLGAIPWGGELHNGDLAAHGWGPRPQPINPTVQSSVNALMYLHMALPADQHSIRHRPGRSLHDPLLFCSSCLVAYNDDPDRTKTEILDLFDHAIKYALEDEAR